MNERQDKSTRNLTPLDEEELEQVTGGGAYFPVEGCPFGYTKIVKNVLGDSRHPQCGMSCGYFDHQNDKCTKTGKLKWE